MEAECSSSSSSYDGSYTAHYSPPHQTQPWTAPTVVDHSSIVLPTPTVYPGDFESALSHAAALKKQRQDATDWEDPARSWLALVRAFQEHNPGHISRMIRLAKTSPWTPQSFQSMIDEGGFALNAVFPLNDDGDIAPDTLPDLLTQRLERESDSGGEAGLEQDSDDAILW